MLYLIILLLSFVAFSQKVYVIERENGAVSVIEGNKVIRRLENLGNLNHAVIKFKGDYGYLITRDGYVVLIDTQRDEVIRKVKAGESTIGITFCGENVAVANYSPETVKIFDRHLNELRTIKTGSRNVGIRAWRNFLVFSLMDKDEIWVTDCEGNLIKRIKTSQAPFDATIYKNLYIAGFFGSSKVGILNLRDFSYREVEIKRGKEPVLKVPHFSMWSVHEDKAYIPGVGVRKVFEISLKDFKVLREFNVSGLPVFVIIAPDKRHLVINFSGDREDYISVIDTETGKERIKRAGRRIMHLRFVKERLYLSSYYEDSVKVLEFPSLKVLYEIPVPEPSGIFWRSEDG